MLKIFTDKNDWNWILKEKFSSFYDTYFLWEYFDIYEKNYDCKKELFFFEDDNIIIFWSHLVRNISNIEWLKKYNNYFDCTTPYWYGWPILIKKTDNYYDSLKLFFEEYEKYSINQNYITEFIRFHPIYENYKDFEQIIDVNKINDVIVLNLEKDIDEIWMKSLNWKRRNQIRREQKMVDKILIKDKLTDKEISNFLQIYYDTMRKNNSSEKYFFSFDYIKDNLDLGDCISIETKKGNNILSQSLFFWYGDNFHYHLSATNYELGYGTSSLILWEAIKYAKNKWYKYFMLWWWTTWDKETDNLFKFKKSFGGEEKNRWFWKIVFNSDIYQDLNKLIWCNDNNFFPKYRINFKKLI